MDNTLKAGVKQLDLSKSGFQRVLPGPPETVRLKSGMVALPAGESVGAHNTGEREELVYVLTGTGEFRTGNGDVLPMAVGSAVYCPPNTEHDVFNTGSDELRYLYVTANLGD
jgi:quercetin dioxygenase-like cupin family protein